MNGIFVFKVIAHYLSCHYKIVALLPDSTNVKILFISVKLTLSILRRNSLILQFYDNSLRL
jgi:hypothetical protein